MGRAVSIRLIAAAGLAATLAAACASEPPQPTQTPGMGWSLSQVEGEGAKLVYGRPQSDDVVIMLTCEPRSNQVHIAALADKGAAHELALKSGDKQRRYPAEAGPAGFGDGLVLESATRPDDPVLAAFAASGRLSVDAGGRAVAVPAADPRRARTFLASCAR